MLIPGATPDPSLKQSKVAELAALFPFPFSSLRIFVGLRLIYITKVPLALGIHVSGVAPRVVVIS